MRVACAGAMDRTVKLWDLASGVQVATSRLQPCTVRALALDAHMLVASASKVRPPRDGCPTVTPQSRLGCLFARRCVMTVAQGLSCMITAGLLEYFIV